MLKVTLLGIAMIFGTILGTSVPHSINYNEVDSVVFAGCEDDECEEGSLCLDNPGGNTGCDAKPDDTCKTYGCNNQGLPGQN